MHRTRSATISLVDEAGEPLPLGSSVDLVTAMGGAQGHGDANVNDDALALADASKLGSTGDPLASPVSRPMIGYDGEVWLEALAAVGNRVQVQLPGSGRCEARFDLPAGAAGPKRLGPIVCRPMLASPEAPAPRVPGSAVPRPVAPSLGQATRTTLSGLTDRLSTERP